MYRIGIDLGGTNMKAGLVNESYDILYEDSLETRVNRPYEDIIRDMANLAELLIAKSGVPRDQFTGIGVGSPGMVDAAAGLVRYSNNFNWQGIPLVDLLKEYTLLPVAISNDANCAALGEQVAGAAKNHQNVFLITLGTGVGSGIIIDGKIFEGGHAGGAEFGHTMLIAGGEKCTCGRHGCIEAYVSATALIRETRRAWERHPNSLIGSLCNNDASAINGKTVFDAALENDPVAVNVLWQYITHLGDAITDAVNIFRPDIVLLSGGICNQGRTLTDPLNEYIRTQCFSTDKAYIPQVATATLDNHAGIIGAAALVNFI